MDSGKGGFMKNKQLPSISEIRKALSLLTKKETILFWLFVLVAIISVFYIAITINNKYLIEIPARGGSLTEGVVGAPRFVNPILATSDVDRDLVSLIYSGLVRPDKNGNYIPDLAEKYEISEDGLTYTFTLKEDLTWHDGEAVTTEDIEFTINKARDPLIKSPKRSSWEGVSIEIVDSKTIKFNLRQAYSSFLDNAIMGIIPKHIWKDVDSEIFSYSTFNIDPVGTGPYKVEKIKKKSSGVPDYYKLVSFNNFSLGRPMIDEITMRFYANENQLLDEISSGKIESANEIPPEKASEIEKRTGNISTIPLPRVFAVFFNQNEMDIFKDESVRKALEITLSKENIVKSVLNGFGTTIDGPIPPGSIGYQQEDKTKVKTEEERINEAKEILKKSGWVANKNTGILEKKFGKTTKKLSFSLTTSDVPQLKLTTELIRDTWIKLGVDVKLEIFEVGDLNTNVIRPRKYQTLFFGEILGRDPDLFSFWHSSQRNDPGLNIAQYTNIKVDKLLEKSRSETDKENRIKIYSQIQEEINKDKPAIFIYSPHMIYALPPKIKGAEMISLTTSSERFNNIYKWYIQTDKVWKIFLNNK